MICIINRQIEIAGLRSIFDHNNTALPLTIKLANEKLMTTAKSAGVDMNNLLKILDETESQEVGSQEQTSDNHSSEAETDVEGDDLSAISTAAGKLTDKVQNTLKS